MAGHRYNRSLDADTPLGVGINHSMMEFHTSVELDPNAWARVSSDAYWAPSATRIAAMATTPTITATWR